ncbi:cell wall-active antibiotics response protein [Pseudonocardia lacus]|uniref:cell wall-active antibiotics response protein n=1 Tax=Pseudonocardia lacus TaxID=2835865 RepID=UPI001BDD1793|nr:cell wall-active antibiotics response protein [Pseudonocardia lacus]
MSTLVDPVPTVPEPAHDRRRPRWDRIVLGLLLLAVGVGWLLDDAGVAVPWRALPAAALIVIGVALLASLAGGTGRADLVVVGVLALLVASAVGVGADRYLGPPGERTIAPARDGWPAPVRMAAGEVVLDLVQGDLPPGGAHVAVGAGTVVLRLPADEPVRVDVRVVTGTVEVDGRTVREGFDLRWSQGPPTSAASAVVDVGAGEVEVRHVRP